MVKNSISFLRILLTTSSNTAALYDIVDTGGGTCPPETDGMRYQYRTVPYRLETRRYMLSEK